MQNKLQTLPKVILAPMAGITSLPFRMLNREFGCKFAFTEMLNCRSLAYKSKKTQAMLATHPSDRPLGIQIVGRDFTYLGSAIEQLKNYEFDLLDLNAACPKRKITRKGMGAALLKEPKHLHKLLKFMVKYSPVPVSLKMRLGWDNAMDAREIALYAQDAGVSAIFLHGRTKTQDYTGDIDYQSIAKVKSALSIPLIASGNIFYPQLAKKMFDLTGCDAVMAARGALGAPWIFEQINSFLQTAKLIAKPDIAAIIKIMLRHFNSYMDFYPEQRGVIEFRKFYIWYTRGLSGTKPLRNKVAQAKTKNEMFALIKNILLSLY
ncbi:MAG: tRNA dihydrouridine synthase DusB [Candidatus Omnitrophota bacterium]|nr:MAG: tRNA dihydrouridine synthase DusB [Candidatus Omnitrophota bacterium]